MGPPPKPDHELISQIPLFWNYENDIHAYIKLKEKEDYLKTKVELKLFEWKLDFWNLLENWSPEDYLIIGVLEIKFKNWNFGY